MPWVPRRLNHILYLPCFLENNPAVLVRLAVTGEEKGNEIICREIDQVCFATVVLEFSEDFKIVDL